MIDDDEIPQNQKDLPLKFEEEPVKSPTAEQIRLQRSMDALYCKHELYGIFDYAIDSISAKDAVCMKKNRSRFMERDYSLPELVEKYVPGPKEAPPKQLMPEHSLEAQSYLRFTSDSFLKDLSIVFGTQLSETHMTDPNPTFDELLQFLQSETSSFLLPYKPYEKIPFPFIVCVGGPPCSGRTTVCQFLQKAFDCYIVDVRKQPADPNAKKSRGTSAKLSSKSSMNQSQMQAVLDLPPEYPLDGSIPVRYPDEKSAPALIASTIKDYLLDGKGFVIDGFPNDKKQQAALEKAMSQEQASVKLAKLQPPQVPQPPPETNSKTSGKQSKKSARPSPKAAKSKAPINCIDGYIITLFAEETSVKQIDPISGNVFKVGFHSPGLSDLLGVQPPHFGEEAKEIQARLIDVPVNNPALNPKVVTQYKSFASSLDKASSVATAIPECESSLHLLEILDSFINRLYAKNKEPLPVEKPMASLLRPILLIKPQLCFTAITTWIRCLEQFGRPMADQSNLISTFASKVGVLSKTATERFQLLISQKDERSNICEHLMKERLTKTQTIEPPQTDTKSSTKRNGNQTIVQMSKSAKPEEKNKPKPKSLAAHFREIWDLSIKIRNNNLELVDQIIDSCGLIELLRELRKAPKLVFIALVHRLLNIMWFTDTFSHLTSIEINEGTRFPFFDELVVPTTEIPKYDFMRNSKPARIQPFRSMYQLNTLIQENKKINQNPQLNETTGVNVSPTICDMPTVVRRQSTTKNTVEVKKEKQDENEKRERKYLTGLRGYDYLVENVQSLKSRPEDKIYFDTEAACNALGIIKMEEKTPFENDPVKFAEEFFAHVEKMLDIKMVAQEAKISLKLFRRFTMVCKRKEVAMVNSVFDLRDALISYAYNKCTKEMEMFARRFRYLRQGGQLPNNVLFQYDTSKISDDVVHLADLALMLKAPINDQELISSSLLLELAQMVVNKGQKFTSAQQFLESARGCKMTNFEFYKLELALRVMECVECFDPQKFLTCFIRSKDEEAKVKDIFSRPPQKVFTQPIIFPRRPDPHERTMSQLSNFSYSLEEEEEEDGD